MELLHKHTVLDSIYVAKQKNIFARHCLASRIQETCESVAEVLQTLKQLSKGCNFKAVTTDQYKKKYIKDYSPEVHMGDLLGRRLKPFTSNVSAAEIGDTKEMSCNVSTFPVQSYPQQTL
ncbi:hypothetical protein CDAR_295711 [Caerostris darwini]|uniref:Uncharacterized protein n=1 Tax=Caerostris darwini TaxID=1538125 RepID=A0AAV4NH73_9ARAC|nr:hypothetical protein CDAR_295711 [Caerostris darwini]